VAGSFLRAYLRTVGEAGLAPAEPRDFERLLQAFLLEKAIYEVGYELNNRPDWIEIPIRGILQITSGQSVLPVGH
jgi:maltose alpha-D-glucosyltransferase/alpha-amylase